MKVNTKEEREALTNEIEYVQDCFTDGQLSSELATLALKSQSIQEHAFLISAARRLNYKDG